MSKHSINFSCGHTETVNLLGNKSQRAYKERRLAEGICSDCEREQFQAKIASENEASAKANADAGLPPLQGTPKQIAWAETLRAQALAMPENSGVMSDDDIDGFKMDVIRGYSRRHPEEFEAIRSIAIGQPKYIDAMLHGCLGGNLEVFNMAIAALRDEMMAARVELTKNDSAKWWIEGQRIVREHVSKHMEPHAEKWVKFIIGEDAQ